MKMSQMIESVLLLCPDVDREEIESDLNLTGDLETTINRALDGMLSPCREIKHINVIPGFPAKETVTIMDDEDHCTSTSKYTTIKEKPTETHRGGVTTNTTNSDTTKSSSVTSVLKPKNIITDTFLEISDSDSEKDEIIVNLGKRYETFESSITTAVTSYVNNDKLFRAESPDSDNESLPPAFDDNEYTGSSSSRMIDIKYKEPVPMKHSVLSCSETSHVSGSLTVKDINVEKVYDKNSCLEEPVKKRKKRSKEEIEEQKRISLLKKQAREKERQEKQEEKRIQKEAKAAEIKQKKLEVEKDKLSKKAEKLTQSTLKLGACVKFVTVCLDPSFFTDNLADLTQSIIVQKLCSMEVSYKIQAQLHPGSVTWQRTSVEHSVQGEEMTITSSNTYTDENEVLVVLATDQFAEMVYAFKQEYQAIDDKATQTLVDFTKNMKDLYRGKKITFLLAGLEKYMRNVKTKQNRAFRDAATGSSDENEGNRKKRKKKINATVNVTRTDIEEALVDLQIKTNVCVYPCETDDDVAMKVALFTKAVAERPFKKSLSDGFGFCLDKLDKTALKVSKDGQGLVRVWQQQIEQFRNVSRDMAAAIVAVYPSPQLLIKAYGKCISEREALLLLEDILVRRGGGSLATSRRIGPELSKRFYILFHSKDNNELMKR